MKKKLKIYLLTLITLSSAAAVFAQGDGPRSFLLLPKGVFGVMQDGLG